MEHGLELIIARLEILEIEVCNIIHNPGNIGNHSFSIFWTPGNIGNLSLQHSPESWKYYPNPEPNPKPKPISLLGPGTGNSGYCGRTRTRAAGASRNPNPLGGLRPPRPPVGFFRDGRGPASYFFNVLFYYSSSSVIFY